MNVGTIAKWLNLPPEKQTALEKAWEVASVAAQGVNSREDAMRVLAEKNIGTELSPARILRRQRLRPAAQ